jgi:hypothetical protein
MTIAATSNGSVQGNTNVADSANGGAAAAEETSDGGRVSRNPARDRMGDQEKRDRPQVASADCGEADPAGAARTSTTRRGRNNA